MASLVREHSEQSGADLVVLPELWTTGAFAYQEFAAEAERYRRQVTLYARAVAVATGVPAEGVLLVV